MAALTHKLKKKKKKKPTNCSKLSNIATSLIIPMASPATSLVGTEQCQPAWAEPWVPVTVKGIGILKVASIQKESFITENLILNKAHNTLHIDGIQSKDNKQAFIPTQYKDLFQLSTRIYSSSVQGFIPAQYKDLSQLNTRIYPSSLQIPAQYRIYPQFSTSVVCVL